MTGISPNWPQASQEQTFEFLFNPAVTLPPSRLGLRSMTLPQVFQKILTHVNSDCTPLVKIVIKSVKP